MKTKHGFHFIGLFTGAPYGDCDETLESYRGVRNSVKKDDVLRHLESCQLARTSAPTYDIVTQEQFGAGLYNDGEYLITTDFVRYL